MNKVITFCFLLFLFSSCTSYKVTEKEYIDSIDLLACLNESSILSHKNPNKLPKSFIKEIGQVCFGYKLKEIANHDDDKSFYKSGLKLIVYEETKNYQILGIQVSGDISTNDWFIKNKEIENKIYNLSSAFANDIYSLRTCVSNSECRINGKVYHFKRT